MIGVIAHQRRKVKRDRESCLTLLKKIAIAFIGFFGSSEAAELAHRPEPATVHRLVNAPRVGRFSRLTQVARRIEIGNAVNGVDLVDGNTRYRCEDALANIPGHAVIIGAKADKPLFL